MQVKIEKGKLIGDTWYPNENYRSLKEEERQEQHSASQHKLIELAEKYIVGYLTNDAGQQYGTVYSKKMPKECLWALQWRQSTRTNSQNIWEQFRIED